MDDLEVEQVGQSLEDAAPQEVLQWAWEQFGEAAAATSSFQTQSVPLLHMISQVVPEMPVLFLDTGFHFQETLAFRDRLVSELELSVKVLNTRMGHDGFKREYGELHRRNPDLCCYLNKVQPLKRALDKCQGWVAGIRRDQTQARRKIPVVAWDSEYGVYKICPLAAWADEDVRRYRAAYDLPVHPLTDKGYTSIGCAPCTRPPAADQDARSGRWAGEEKTECGLHFDGPEEENE